MAQDDPALEWDVERDDELNMAGCITIGYGGEGEHEFSVFTMIPPAGGPA